jgi:hypothetical protein
MMPVYITAVLAVLKRWWGFLLMFRVGMRKLAWYGCYMDPWLRCFVIVVY